MDSLLLGSVIASVVLGAAILAASRAVVRALREARESSLVTAIERLTERVGGLERRVQRSEASSKRRDPRSPSNSEERRTPLSICPTIAHSTPLQRTELPFAAHSTLGAGQDIAPDVRRLLSRGYAPVEIAQTLDIDIGRVELIMQLDAAAASASREFGD